MSVGHGSGVIDRAWSDALDADIQRKVTINRNYNVPLAAGISADGKTVYIDHRIPPIYDRYLIVHEYYEWLGLEQGFAYLPAHGAATAVEITTAENDKVDISKYDKFFDKWCKVTARTAWGDNTPPDMHPTQVAETLKEQKK